MPVPLPTAATERSRATGAGHPVARRQPPALEMKVVTSSAADGDVLVEADHASIAQGTARAPVGSKVVEEQWYR